CRAVRTKRLSVGEWFVLASRLTSQPHRVTTKKPWALSCSILVASRRRLFRILSDQNSRLAFGSFAKLQPLCPCQKHPCTNTAHRRLLFAMSGEPGRSRLFTEKRRPRCQRCRRTTISKSVPWRRTRFIRADVTGETFDGRSLKLTLPLLRRDFGWE